MRPRHFGMSSQVGGRGYKNTWGMQRGTRYHRIAEAVSKGLPSKSVLFRAPKPAPPAPAPPPGTTGVKTMAEHAVIEGYLQEHRERKEMVLGSYRVKNWATVLVHHWTHVASEVRVRVGRSVSILDQVYYDPETDTCIHVELKSGYPGQNDLARPMPPSLLFLLCGKDTTRAERDREQHRFQAVGGALSWNKAIELGNPPVPSFPKKIARAFVFYFDAGGPKEIEQQDWWRYYLVVSKLWGLGKASEGEKKKNTKKSAKKIGG